MSHLLASKAVELAIASNPQAFRPVKSPLHHTKGLMLREASIVQVDRGEAIFKSLHVTGKETVLTMLRSDRRTAGYVVVDPIYTAVMVPLFWQGDYIFDGHYVEPGEVFLSDPWNGHHSSRASYGGLSIGVSSAKLVQMVRDLIGGDQEMVDLSGGLLATGASGGFEFRNHILRLISLSVNRSRTRGHSTLSRFEETEILEGVARLVIDNRIARTTQDNSLSDTVIVSRALDGLDFLAQNVVVGDLCRNANCGETRLYEAFVSVLGIPPGLFIKRLRLEKARSLLADPAVPQRTVKQIVYALGVKNGGRFADQYRQVFGQSPKETLRSRRFFVA